MAEILTHQMRKDLFKRSHGRCECVMQCSHHMGKKCQNPLIEGDWEAHRMTADGPYMLSNLKALCGTCHAKSLS